MTAKSETMRRVLDTVDDMRSDLSSAEALIRVMRHEIAALRARVRELEHDLGDHIADSRARAQQLKEDRG